jgi:hypothetical protein
MTAAWEVPNSPWWWASWTANPPTTNPTQAIRAFQRQLAYARQHRTAKETP